MQCTFTKTDGSRCAANAIRDSEYCFSHDPGQKSAKLEAVRRGGEARKVFHKCGEPISISGPNDIQTLLAKTIEGVWSGIIPANQPANTIGFLARCYLDVYEKIELEVKIGSLEEKINEITSSR